MKITFFYRVKPKVSAYKPVFYKPEEEQSGLEKKLKLQKDESLTLRERMNRRWEEERKYKSVSQKNIIRIIVVIAILIYIIFFLKL